MSRVLTTSELCATFQVLLKTRVHCIGPAVRLFVLHCLAIPVGSKSKKLIESVTVYQRKWKESQDVPCHFGIVELRTPAMPVGVGGGKEGGGCHLNMRT